MSHLTEACPGAPARTPLPRGFEVAGDGGADVYFTLDDLVADHGALRRQAAAAFLQEALDALDGVALGKCGRGGQRAQNGAGGQGE